MGQESSNNEEYMMTLKNATESNAPDVESNSEQEEEAKDTTPRHPETIIAMPVAPESKKMKTVCCLLDMCATGLLMDPKFFDKFLRDYRDAEAFTRGSKSQWATGNGIFTSNGKVTISNPMLSL
eukprot:8310036-Ditylum_brightwellii.AAC.1